MTVRRRGGAAAWLCDGVTLYRVRAAEHLHRGAERWPEGDFDRLRRGEHSGKLLEEAGELLRLLLQIDE